MGSSNTTENASSCLDSSLLGKILGSEFSLRRGGGTLCFLKIFLEGDTEIGNEKEVCLRGAGEWLLCTAQYDIFVILHLGKAVVGSERTSILTSEA